MNKKNKNKKHKQQYSKEIEAAWYAVSRFISPFDYVIRYTDIHYKKHIITANPNCVIAARMSKNNLFKPISISKYMLQDHFNRDTILFYKCAPNAKLSTGFGKYDKTALALTFSSDLEVTTRKITDSKYFVLLIGIDIDCHNGEKHVKEVEELIKKYLPFTYWEDSTNGKGRHGYLKIKFINSFGVIETISDCLNKLFFKFNEIKNLYGYEAKIDDPAGLPYKLEFKDINPYHENWTTLFHRSGKKNIFLGRYISPKSQIWKDYLTYLKNNTVHHISDELYSRPDKLISCISEKEIKNTFSVFLDANNILFSAPTKNNKFYKITVQRAFKLPMFDAASTDTDNSPRMDCIKDFHSLPYYTSSELKTVYNQIWSDIKEFSDITLSNIVCPSYSVGIPGILSGCYYGSKTDSYSFTVSKETVKTNINTKIIKISPYKKKVESICNNCACTNTLNNSKNIIIDKEIEKNNNNNNTDIIDWSDIYSDNREFDIDVFWDNYKYNKKNSNTKKYEETVNILKDEKDTMKKAALFISAFINKLGRIPTVDEAEKEYVEQGLNNNSQDSTVNRRNRFSSCIGYYSGCYDESEAGFSSDWNKEKAEVLQFIKSQLPEDLLYRQGKRIKNIAHEEIGYIYHIIKKMEESDQEYILANSLSYSRADELFIGEFGKKCGRHKFAGIIKILLGSCLIEKSGNYKVGLRGNCYRVKVG